MAVRRRLPVVVGLLLVLAWVRSNALGEVPNFAQAAALIGACGPSHERIEAKVSGVVFSETAPTPGHALVYVITDAQRVPLARAPITRIGVDGRWQGGNRLQSYITFEVTPGVHHLCAALGARGFFMHAVANVALAKLNAKSGQTYYYLNRSIGAGDAFTLDPVNEDEAAMLLETYPRSESHVP